MNTFKFRITDHLSWESTGDRWVSITKGQPKAETVYMFHNAAWPRYSTVNPEKKVQRKHLIFYIGERYT